MTVSKREFYDLANWKDKRYQTVIYQTGKNPADFEFVETQDAMNFELQQAINSIARFGCIGTAFDVVPSATPGANTVRIYQGRAYAQSFVSGAEFSGIRLDMPDVLTTFPSLTYEHEVDGNGYYAYDFTAEQSTVPPAGSYRYDLIYLEFWRKEYEPSDDPEMQDSILGETTFREKWYYEFHFYQGDNVDLNPDIPALASGHHGMRLAVIKRQNTAIVDAESVIDIRPKYSPSANFTGANIVTVGAEGGNYETLYDVIASRTGVNAITPTVSDPYTIHIQPGIHTCPFQFSLGTLGHIKIVGSGVDKTILEFSDIYSLAPSAWIDIGVTPSIEFCDLTIRFESTYSAGAKLMNIDGGNVVFRNCKLGEVNTSMEHSGIYINDATVRFDSCEVNSRSTTVPCINLAGTCVVKINDSIIRQSNFRVFNNESLLTGDLYISDSRIYGNNTVLYLNGITEISDTQIIKSEWLSGDSVNSGNTIYGLAPVTFYNCKITGPSGNNDISIVDDSEFHNCYHDGEIIHNDPSIVKFHGCILTKVSASNSATPEFYSCEFLDDGSVTVTLTSITSALFMDCVFKRDGACLTVSDAPFTMMNCKMGTTGVANLIEVGGTCSPKIQNCNFVIDNAGASGINMAAITATPIVTHCTFTGNASALMFNAGSAVTIEAGHISGNTTLKHVNVTITNIEKTL